ncbi:SDR family NAD(P)-dependent oxidoreductase, partial [Streptomyces carpinensis]
MTTATSLFDLRGRLAVVTGARRGIGLAIAQALADAGADIIGVSAHLEQHSEVGELVAAAGRRFEGVRCDFTDRRAVQELGAELAGRRPDILVNNA